jgi:hypothetical protein
VGFVGVAKGNAGGCISNGSNDGDQKSREGRFLMVAVSKPPTTEGKTSQMEGKGRKRGIGIGDMLEQKIAGSVKCFCQRRGPRVEDGG